MTDPATLRVKGLREFVRAADHAGPDSRRAVRATFRTVGDAVRLEAGRLFQKYDARSAAGYKVSVRLRGVSVDQSIRKTTGTRPDYGALQMRKALLPALRDKEAETEFAMEHAIDSVADHFDRL